MPRIVVFMSVTLDGVMQAPARPDEDSRGGFQHGGWAVPYSDSSMATAAGESMATTGGLILGSGELVRSLMRSNLIDQYILLIHPLLLGSGQRLFPDDGSPQALRLVDSKTTTTGVVIATYVPA